MKIRTWDIALTAVVLLVVGGGVWGMMFLDAGMSGKWSTAESGRPVASAPAKDPRLELKTALPEMIRLLEAKDYAGLYREFVPPGSSPLTPEDYAKLVNSTPEGNQAMAKTLAGLRSLKDRAPQIDANGNRATYSLDPVVAGRSQMSFIKINGLWYIQG